MIEYFTDPVLFAPTLGSMLMCLIAAFVGTFSILEKRSLIGEALSHASYPGVILSLVAIKLFVPSEGVGELLLPLIGAALSCLLGMYIISKLVSKYRVHADSALCFIIASFFGVALVVLSALQGTYPTLYRELSSYLFGQAALQTTTHLYVYSALVVSTLGITICFYRPIKAVLFDKNYAAAIGINVGKVQALLLAITVVAVVIGIRTLGVVLISSMLIFPGVTSRMWTSRLEYVLLFACLVGVVSGFFGVFLSHEMSKGMVTLPTGPMIVVVGAFFFIISSLFSPKRGILFCAIRRWGFLIRCQQENLLKSLWKANVGPVSRADIARRFQANPVRLSLLLQALVRRGWLRQNQDALYELTPSGLLWGRKIVRLHRLWEVYLVEYCGVGVDRVHPSAEEMEHIITPEIEKALMQLLDNPQHDPHKQPIPEVP